MVGKLVLLFFVFFVSKCQALDFKMEVKYLIPYASETIILTTSPDLVWIRRLWQRYYSLETFKNWFSEVKLAETKMNLILNC